MWVTRQDRNIRVWFQAVRSTGRLRSGLASGDFVVRVISSNDAASITPFVTESVQRPGNYFFDAPSTFFLGNGIGDYGVSIEIDSFLSSGAPNVVSTMAGSLYVSKEDFDTMSGSIWNSSASAFNMSGTMGYLLNQTDSNNINVTASVDINSIVDGVWNASSSQYQTSGTMGFLQNSLAEISSSVSFIKGIENGTWIIAGSQMVFYASGTNEELARFNLQDIAGTAIDPLTQHPFRRVRV